MPLASRATQSRASRTEAAKTEPVAPRRQSTATTKPAPAREDPPEADVGAEEVQQSASEAPEPTPTPRPRKPRADKGATRVPRQQLVTAEGDTPTPTGIKARMREIEGEFKALKTKHAGELRDLQGKQNDERNALQREHRALATQLSQAVFK